MDREGQPHDGVKIVWAGRDGFFIDMAKHVGRSFLTYGQTKIQEDLFEAADRRNATVLAEVDEVVLENLTSERPGVRFLRKGETE
jgi:p-hydroxybenzoate 3-monooxygenase